MIAMFVLFGICCIYVLYWIFFVMLSNDGSYNNKKKK